MPNHLFRLPRYLLILLLILVGAALLIGTFRAFLPARAQAIGSPTPTILLIETPTGFNLLGTAPTEIPNLPPGTSSADTTGIIALTIILVAIVIFGTFWGWRISHPRKTKK
jgi:hypothetical protein